MNACSSPKQARDPRRGRGKVSRSGQRKIESWLAQGRIPAWLRWPRFPREIEVADGGAE